NLLGVRTLEGFGVMVDHIAHRFVATTTLVAGAIFVATIPAHDSETFFADPQAASRRSRKRGSTEAK
ncbi:MAG: hypothetical protein ABI651_18055, partial [Verrucomicrobiota bacterium]